MLRMLRGMFGVKSAAAPESSACYQEIEARAAKNDKYGVEVMSKINEHMRTHPNTEDDDLLAKEKTLITSSLVVDIHAFYDILEKARNQNKSLHKEPYKVSNETKQKILKNAALAYVAGGVHTYIEDLKKIASSPMNEMTNSQLKNLRDDQVCEAVSELSEIMITHRSVEDVEMFVLFRDRLELTEEMGKNKALIPQNKEFII